MADKSYIRFDWAAKRLLRDKANFEVLEGLVSTLLNQDIKIEHIAESESNKSAKFDKSNIVDIKAVTDKGEHIIIELQNLYQMDFLQRILFGTATAITDQLSMGSKYSEIRKVYSISIVFFPLGVGDDYLYHGCTEICGVHSGTELKLTDEESGASRYSLASGVFPEYYILRVSEFNDVATTPLEEWFDYIKNNRVKDNPTAKGLKRVKEILSFDSMTIAEQDEYRAYLNQRSSEEDSLRRATESGKSEERLAIARRMKADGEDAQKIRLYTGISEDDIANL